MFYQTKCIITTKVLFYKTLYFYNHILQGFELTRLSLIMSWQLSVRKNIYIIAYCTNKVFKIMTQHWSNSAVRRIKTLLCILSMAEFSDYILFSKTVLRTTQSSQVALIMVFILLL